MSENTPDNKKYPANPVLGKKTPDNKPVKNVQNVVTGKVTQRKPSFGRKLASAFSGDDMSSVVSYVAMDVLVPAAKNAISDAISQGIDRLLFGDSRPRSSGGIRTNYSVFSRPGSPASKPATPAVTARARAVHDFEGVILEHRADADAVLDQLVELVEQYGAATVSDFYQMVGITGSFADDKWGWTDLRDARVVRGRDGYYFDLPRTADLK